MLLVYACTTDDVREGIDLALERGGWDLDSNGRRGMQLYEEPPVCPTPGAIEFNSDIGSFYVIEVVLPHTEAELACYLAPESQGRTEGREWIIPAYVLRGCPARVVSFAVERRVLGRPSEAAAQEWASAIAEYAGLPDYDGQYVPF
jgi:hypothetical protein